MAYACVRDTDRELAVVTMSGTMELADCIDAIRQFTADTGHVPEWPIIADLRDLQYQPASSDIETIAEHLGHAREKLRGPIGIVVGSKAMLLAGRIACALAAGAGIQMQAFLDLEQAEAWCLTVCLSR